MVGKPEQNAWAFEADAVVSLKTSGKSPKRCKGRDNPKVGFEGNPSVVL